MKERPRFADFGLIPPNWEAFPTTWISAFAQAYPWLQKIHFKRMSVTNDDLQLISLSFPYLYDLILFNFNALEKLLARSPNLKKLRVNRFVTIDQLYRLMVRAPQLTHLGTGSFSPSEVWLPAHQDLDYRAAFAACKSLVCLSSFREIAPVFLPSIYPVCANLTSLNFSYANLNAEELASVICHCHNLHTFWGWQWSILVDSASVEAEMDMTLLGGKWIWISKVKPTMKVVDFELYPPHTHLLRIAPT